MYIKRKIEGDILRYLKRPEIIAIVGPRQCGKTTVLKRVYETTKNAVFLTFEDQGALSLFENNIKQFINTYVKGRDFVFIDEFQYAKTGGKLLKYIYDTERVKMIISGSSAIDLTVKAIKYLVGRVFILNMFQFDFYEFLLYKNSDFARLYSDNQINLNRGAGEELAPEQMKVFSDYYEEYCVWGGYPEVVLADNLDEKKEVLKNIYNTYFIRDVKSILGIVDDFKLEKLIKALALQIGNMVEYNELSQVSEFSVPTLKKYLNFLSKTYILELVSPFYTNKRKEIVKNKKIYFFDNGLRNLALNDLRGFDLRIDAGALLENGVFMQLLKNNMPVKFWRDKNKNEIDFIIDAGNGKTVAIEVKNNTSKCKPAPLSFTKEHAGINYYCAYLKGKDAGKKESLFLPLV